MADSTPKYLHVRGHTSSQLCLRVIAALEVSHGMNPVQTSGLQRFSKQLDPSPMNLTEEEDLVSRFFNLFDALFFERSLRYVVTTKIKHVTSPVHTCCKGVVCGGRLVVQVEKSSSSWKSAMLGRLLHDMIHVYLWRYGKSSFINNGLFEKGWGFSGHGTAWQDIAILLDRFLESNGLPIPLGRVESLRLELESFSDWVSASFLNQRTKEEETNRNSLDNMEEKPNKNELQLVEIQKNHNCPRPQCYQCSHRGQPIMIRRKSRRLSKSIPPRIAYTLAEKKDITKTIDAPAHISKAQLNKTEEKVSTYALGVREFLIDNAETCVGILSAPITAAT